jgi:MFS family permease
VFFIGLLVGSVTLPRYSDTHGRKTPMIAGNILHVVAALIFIVNKNKGIALLL